jgi:hypothetical protein
MKVPKNISADHEGVIWRKVEEQVIHGGRSSIYKLLRRDGLQLEIGNNEDDVSIRDSEGNWVHLDEIYPTSKPSSNFLTIIERVNSKYPLLKETDARETMISRTKDIQSAIKFKNTLETRKSIDLHKAREAFSGLGYENEFSERTGVDNSHARSEYHLNYIDVGEESVSGEADLIATISLGHLKDWPDEDFDYGGGNTTVEIRLMKEGNITYEFKGDKMDVSAHAGIEKEIARVNREL